VFVMNEFADVHRLTVMPVKARRGRKYSRGGFFLAAGQIKIAERPGLCLRTAATEAHWSP
jgi:hypothetical protein